MSAPNTTRWIGVGLLGLPLYGLMTFFSSLDPQPDPNTHYEAFSRFVTSGGYVFKHLFLSDLGVIFVIFGMFALGAYLTRSRAGIMGLVAMVIAVFGQALFLLIGGVSTFATPVEGQAYLAGIEEYRKQPTSLAGSAQTATFGVSVLLQFVGNVLLGVAVCALGDPAQVGRGAVGVRTRFDVRLWPGVRDDDRRPSHPSYGARRGGAFSDRRGVDGLKRPEASHYRPSCGSSDGPAEGALSVA